MKKIVFLLILAFSFNSLNALENSNKNSKSNNLVEILPELVKVGTCSFTYTLYAYNKVTGERQSFTYSHTTQTDTEAECRAYAKTHARTHAMFLQSALNK